MKYQSLHTHSLFCDGTASLEDMVKAALALGLDSIGFSGHTPMPGVCWTMPQDKLPEYYTTSCELKNKYKDQIPVFIGMEWDIDSERPPFETDYIIASNHFIRIGNYRFQIDYTMDVAREGIKRYFDGDFHAAEDTYYAAFEKVINFPCASVIGHYDVITKFDETRKYFRYAPQSALDMMEKLVKADKIFEVNTNAIRCSGRITPFPSLQLLQALHEMNGRVTISADAHGTDALIFDYDNQITNLKKCGFDEIWQLTNDGFVPKNI